MKRKMIDDNELAGMEREARAALRQDPTAFLYAFEHGYVTPWNVVGLIERLRRAESAEQTCPCHGHGA